MKAVCPKCETLQTITPTGARIGEWGSASWKLIAEHGRNPETLTNGVVIEERCPGSGKRV